MEILTGLFIVGLYKAAETPTRASSNWWGWPQPRARIGLVQIQVLIPQPPSQTLRLRPGQALGEGELEGVSKGGDDQGEAGWFTGAYG